MYEKQYIRRFEGIQNPWFDFTLFPHTTVFFARHIRERNCQTVCVTVSQIHANHFEALQQSTFLLFGLAPPCCNFIQVFMITASQMRKY
ncbi:hypothetical protein NC77_20345 [Janthinobacterium lividum]|nr:hypothetical protein NC77_20345 [Janthinobacterium lividum]